MLNKDARALNAHVYCNFRSISGLIEGYVMVLRHHYTSCKFYLQVHLTDGRSFVVDVHYEHIPSLSIRCTQLAQVLLDTETFRIPVHLSLSVLIPS